MISTSVIEVYLNIIEAYLNLYFSCIYEPNFIIMMNIFFGGQTKFSSFSFGFCTGFVFRS